MKNLLKKCALTAFTFITPLIILSSCESQKDVTTPEQKTENMFQEMNQYKKEESKEPLGGKTLWGTSEDSNCLYAIKKGDTLSIIAEKYNTTADELARINSIKDKNLIYEDNKIITREGCEY